MAAARPLVTVHAAGADGASSEAKMPAVFLAPIRNDIVQFVHTNMRKNRRQAYAVSPGAGHQHSAESWGTGRAVSRIPRVSGSGTARAGQGAFGNMCRKGRMFAPTKTFRRWHRKINKNQRRFATVSALAASALPALVMARGHRIDDVPEIPLVVSKDAAQVKKTSEAVALLKLLGADADLVKAKESKRTRAGKGKARGRRYVQRKGPLVVFKSNEGIVKACRNLPGVDLCHVNRLNLLQLAPGGHLGRFIVWTEDAFKSLDSVFGTTTQASKQKFGYTLPRSQVTNSDITRIINSDEIQSKINPKKRPQSRPIRKKNPLKNLGVMVRLNPYNMVTRRAAIRLQQQRAASRAAQKDAKRKQTKAQRKAKDFNKKHRATKKATWQSIIRD